MRIVYILSLYCLISCTGKTENADKARVTTDSSAESNLVSIVKTNPDSLLAWENLIQYYRENDDYPKALSTLANAMAKDSISERLYYIKGTLQYENEDTAGAIRSFEKAVLLRPSAENIFLLSSLYAETGDKRSLLFADDLSLKWKVAAEKTLFIKGIYYSAINDKQKAIQYMDECLKLNFTYMQAYREKALALYDMGKYEDALQVLNKAVTLQNSYEEGYYYMGQCFEKLHRMPDAIEAYRKALMYDPGYSEAKEALEKIDKPQ